MRLWSLHPRYLDRKGLLALWREGLLAQKVLAGDTRGYRSHPQLERFRAHPEPAYAIAAYLRAVCEEADRRGYRFDRGRILGPAAPAAPMEVTEGQLLHELGHLAGKLEERAPEAFERLRGVGRPEPHPCLVVVPGPMASWERP